MNKITTALLGLLLILLGSSCRSTQAVSENDYDLIAILSFDPTVDSTAQPKYLIKNLDGTPFDTLDMNAEYNFFNNFGSPKLSGKIAFFFPEEVRYAFFCKRPEAGKPIEVRVGDEWKTLESSAHIQIDSTGKFLQQYTYVPRGEEGERLPLDFYPNPKVAPGKKITLIQDSFGRGFFIRDVQGEWMKIQGIDYSACPDREGVIEEEEWAKVSKASEVNPSYWIHWREGSKILIYPNEFVHKYSV